MAASQPYNNATHKMPAQGFQVSHKGHLFRLCRFFIAQAFKKLLSVCSICSQ